LGLPGFIDAAIVSIPIRIICISIWWRLRNLSIPQEEQVLRAQCDIGAETDHRWHEQTQNSNAMHTYGKNNIDITQPGKYSRPFV